MATDDDYEPTDDPQMEPESPTGEAPPAPSDDGGNDDDYGEASGYVSPRRGRVISDKVRDLFREGAKTVKAQVAEDDDEDIQYDEEPVTPAPATGAGAAAILPAAPRLASTPVAAPAPSLDPAVAELRSKLEARYQELDAREQALVARETTGDIAKLQQTFVDKGSAAAIVELVKQWTGAGTDEELRDEIADLITDLTGHSLGVKLPDDIRTKLDSKRALRSVKATQAKLDRREQELQTRDQEAQRLASVKQVVNVLDLEVRKPELAKQYPFLSLESNAGELIYETVEQALKREGTELPWKDAAKRVDDYLNRKWREEHDKRAHLFAASPAPAGVAPNGNRERPQGDPQGIRRSHTLTNAATSTAPTTPAPPPSNGRWSNEDHRARTKAKMRAAFKNGE